MKNFTLSIKSLLIFIIVLQTGVSFSQSIASYNITFSSVWENEIVDPENGNSTATIPGNAHWSNLVGATHNSNYKLVEMGTLATTGVKNVAETGNNDALMIEVLNEINNTGNVNQWLQEPMSPFNNISSATLSDVIVNSDFPLLSLVSMIAPSPDWMIAINGINLRTGGTWNNEIIIPLFPYDAGTDSGSMYASANLPTVPNPEPISALINQAPFNAKPIGTITISLNEVLSLPDQEITKVLVSPNPSNGLIKISTSNSNIMKETLVFDVLGKQVVKMNNKDLDSSLKLDLTALNKGIYLVKFELQDGAFITKRLVLN
ncbi:T9SS type A sorting domain-containing protein [Psychroserpens ponticola]|uniref:Spondin domain-containing protein n=1 Tax=Psychroserpens ponticola TaxID=2932268 RepID=A0ABY7S033_9FLAO|nr:spondin domain-containing protein [Psychroserpens ponticola]WCO02662.1 spondin domain-containing protein [Psychroserpens ponticola]